MFKYKKFLSVEEIGYLAKTATCPADLIDLVPRLGVDLEFAGHLSDLWRKEFDKKKDADLLREIANRSARYMPQKDF